VLEYEGGNRLQLLRSGEQYFPALVAAIDAARAEVFLETYIYADDETGSQVADALARAAARGVATHLLIDGFGAKNFAPRFREMLTKAGANVLVFRPHVSPSRSGTAAVRRMHRKGPASTARLRCGGMTVIDH
jgi:cardiolipin synthase